MTAFRAEKDAQIAEMKKDYEGRIEQMRNDYETKINEMDKVMKQQN